MLMRDAEERKGLVTALVERRMITTSQRATIIAEAKQTGRKLHELLIEKGWVAEGDVFKTLADHMGQHPISLKKLVSLQQQVTPGQRLDQNRGFPRLRVSKLK